MPRSIKNVVVSHSQKNSLDYSLLAIFQNFLMLFRLGDCPANIQQLDAPLIWLLSRLQTLN
jgi:hypothetical protein